MITTFSSGDSIDPLALVLADDRKSGDRPWVMINMIASVDGGTAVDGKSSSLGDQDDLEMFRALRTVPDVILVGASTVAAENYRPVSLDEPRRALRAGMGRPEVPVLAIVSGRLSVHPEAQVFSDSNYRPMVMTGPEADPTRLMMLGDAAEVVILQELTPKTILDHLSAASIVLVEGGPSLNGQFVSAGVVDEINLTVAPYLMSGDSARIAHGAHASPPLEMRLDRILRGDRALFVRYLRSDHSQGS